MSWVNTRTRGYKRDTEPPKTVGLSVLVEELRGEEGDTKRFPPPPPLSPSNDSEHLKGTEVKDKGYCCSLSLQG